jgi:citrate synthase
MGFPPQFFTVLFAIPRVAGYLSHWREQLSDPDVKIARPQQNYMVRPASLRTWLSCGLAWASLYWL